MQGLGRMMVVAGLVLVVLGALVWWLGPRFGGNGGLLPGDLSLRRGNMSADQFPDEVIELIGYLNPPQPDQPVRAIPGEGTQVPIWMLGSSLYGAQLAAHMGLPYAFASHFAPDALEPAIRQAAQARLIRKNIELHDNIIFRMDGLEKRKIGSLCVETRSLYSFQICSISCSAARDVRLGAF